MCISKITKAIQVAEEFTIELFKNSDTKQATIIVSVDSNNNAIQLDKFKYVKDGYVFNVKYKNSNAEATIATERVPIGLQMSSEAIAFLSDISKKVGKSKSAVVESLLMELKNK